MSVVSLFKSIFYAILIRNKISIVLFRFCALNLQRDIFQKKKKKKKEKSEKRKFPSVSSIYSFNRHRPDSILISICPMIRFIQGTNVFSLISYQNKYLIWPNANEFIDFEEKTKNKK